MAGQATNTPLNASAVTRGEPARVEGGIADARAAEAESLRPRPGDADPSLEGIPLEVIESVGAYDTDVAGGCG